MRRLIAYFTITASILIGIAINFMNVAMTTNSNLEFKDGRQFVYRLTDKEDEDAPLPEEAVKEMAQTMIGRLDIASVNQYEVEVEGSNQIRITLAASNETRYTRVRQLLNFDGEFTICTSRDTCMGVDELIFEGSVARVDYINQFPFVVIPINLDVASVFKQTIVEEAMSIQNQFGETEEGEGINRAAKIFLWANWVDGDTYEGSLTDEKMAEKIILEFDYTSLYWDAETESEIAAIVDVSRYGRPNENNIFPSDAVRQANEEAYHYVNLFNANPLVYNVEFLFEQNVSASIENIFNYGLIATLSWSNTLMAATIGAIILILAIAYFYRLLSPGIIATGSLTLFITALVFNLLGLQFSSATIIAMLVVLALVLISNLLYISNLRNEIYRGRTLKKAHVEASRKAMLPIIDLSVITFVFGLISYWLGGNLVGNFAVFTMFGSVANLLFVLLVGRGIFWLITNEPEISKRLNWLAIDSNKVPDTLKEEKQTYFGRFAKINFGNKKMTVGIGSALFSLVGLALVIFLGVTQQPLIASSDSEIKTRLYFEINERSEIDSIATLENDIIANLTVNDQPFVYETITVHELTRTIDEVPVNFEFYVVSSNINYSGNEDAAFYVDDVKIDEGSLEEVLYRAVYAIDEDEEIAGVSIHNIELVTQPPRLDTIAISVTVASVVAIAYMATRYFIARAIATLVSTTLVSFITMSFFFITRIQSLPIVALSLLIVSLFTIYLSVFVFSKEKQIISDQRPDSTVEAIILRETSSAKAVSIQAATLFLISGLMAYIGLNFFGFAPIEMAPMFAGVTLGIAMATLLVTSINGPLSIALAKLLKKININIKWPTLPRRKKAKKPEIKTAEPQEATFIGIND
jgi:hypothetical protein